MFWIYFYLIHWPLGHAGGHEVRWVSSKFCFYNTNPYTHQDWSLELGLQECVYFPSLHTVLDLCLNGNLWLYCYLFLSAVYFPMSWWFVYLCSTVLMWWMWIILSQPCRWAVRPYRARSAPAFLSPPQPGPSLDGCHLDFLSETSCILCPGSAGVSMFPSVWGKRDITLWNLIPHRSSTYF